MATWDEKYNSSDKGRARYLKYYYRNLEEVNYGRSRRRLRNRISDKQSKIAELERMLNNAEEV